MKTRSIQRNSSKSLKNTRNKTKKVSNKMDMRELILIQSIVCAVLLFLGLMLNNRSNYVNNLISNVKTTITRNFVVQNPIDSISSIFSSVSSNYSSENSTLRIDEDVLYEINKRNEIRSSSNIEKK